MTPIDRQYPVTRALGASFRDETVVAAVSGGPDSMAMLHGLATLARERPELRVIAAHFDHRLRPDSHRDGEMVREAADRGGARFVSGCEDVRQHAANTRQSLEAAARELRYAFLDSIADDLRADVIATAHTRDDQIETVLMRIVRGAHARGLRGILPRRGCIVRPLLDVARADTHAYCRAHGIDCIEDPSNRDLRFERNKVRHRVLPQLRGVYPAIDDALLRIAEVADAEFRRADAAVAARVQAALAREDDHTWVLGRDVFDNLDDANDRAHVISAALDIMDAREDVATTHYASLLALVNDRAGAMVDLPGMRVRREHDGLTFTRRTRAITPDASAHTLPVPGTLDLDGWHIDARHVDAPASKAFLNSDACVAYVAGDHRVTVRYPRAGDRMQPFGMNGHKKLSDVFIDRKIPKRHRATTPVVESNGEIVWVVGVATGEGCRMIDTPGPVVRLTATRSRP